MYKIMNTIDGPKSTIPGITSASAIITIAPCAIAWWRTFAPISLAPRRTVPRPTAPRPAGGKPGRLAAVLSRLRVALRPAPRYPKI